MRSLKRLLFFAACCLFQTGLSAQDTLKLTCPFQHGTGREPKEAFTWDPPDKKVIVVSQSDTMIRAAHGGTVSNVNPNEDGLYEVVIFYKNYYMWYYNVTRPLVKKNDKVTTGQNIGIYTIGNELEFRVFRNEELLDPRNWLECKIPKAE